MKTYIEHTFKNMKTYWFFVILTFVMCAFMKWYFKDQSATIALFVMGIFLTVAQLIGSYLYIQRNNLW